MKHPPFLPNAQCAFPMRRVHSRLDGSLWGITTFFNPVAYARKLSNLELFARRVRDQGLRLLIIEAALLDYPFQVTPSVADILVQVRVQHTLWHKEALINKAVRHLPRDCDKVAWLDGDILFEDAGWVEQTASGLEKYSTMQLFSTARWGLPPLSTQNDLYSREHDHSAPVSRIAKSSAALITTGGAQLRLTGHMGFAWATRRAVLEETPLYDAMIVGGGDYIIASAMYGYSATQWLSKHFSIRMRNHIQTWMKAFHREVRGSVGVLQGSVTHLWHGSVANRRYLTRYAILLEEEFDPLRDIVRKDCLIYWSTDKARLRLRVASYFASRAEDQP